MTQEVASEPLACVACFGPRTHAQMPRAALEDADGARVDPSLPPVVDAHVHLFQEGLFDAIWRWFDAYGWPIRYKLYTPDVIQFLLSRGVSHVVALHYAHKPGIARGMNAFIAEIAKNEPRVTGLATVFPGEPGARAILNDAFDMGLRGVKLHCHVQCFAPDADALGEIYETCVARGMPLVMHAGREPKSEALKCDPYTLCSAERTARVLVEHPRLKLCVPHLGLDELDGYARLLERHENLWLDTTMTMADYFPDLFRHASRMIESRPDRIFYGTDFPNVPYAWDRELTRLSRLSDALLPAVLGENARAFFGI